MDYFVPNFGKDHEIGTTDESLSIAEKQLKHKFVINDAPKSDKKDYFVPNFGVDKDIADSNNSLDQSESALGHTWTPTQDDNGYWNVPAPFANDSYNYHNRDVFLQLDAESDPICSSAGCTQYEHPKKKGYPMDYFVPNFGKDHEIGTTDESLSIAEKQLKHKFVINDAPKSDKKDYFVPNFGVDKDIADSKSSLDQSESTLGHTWTPTQDENGYWTVPTPFANDSYNYHNRDVFVQLGASSDPVCSSAGCPKGYFEKYVDPNIVQYTHPPLDGDIKTTFEHDKLASEITGEPRSIYPVPTDNHHY